MQIKNLALALVLAVLIPSFAAAQAGNPPPTQVPDGIQVDGGGTMDSAVNGTPNQDFTATANQVSVADEEGDETWYTWNEDKEYYESSLNGPWIRFYNCTCGDDIHYETSEGDYGIVID